MDPHSRSLFTKLKPICTSLFNASPTTPALFSSLTALATLLQQTPPEDLTLALIEYTFFPLSNLLQHHPIRTLPNHIVEQIFLILSSLAEQWFWTFDPQVWEQLVILASSVLARLDGQKRDEETYIAATKTLHALFRTSSKSTSTSDLHKRITLLSKTTPPKTLGQSLSSLLPHSHTPNTSLQHLTLSTLHAQIQYYLPQHQIPSILPGVITNTCRIVLELGSTKGQNVAEALDVMRVVIVRGMSDEICIQDGALRDIQTLDDLLSSPTPASTTNGQDPSVTPRTPSWLAATSSQTHMALNKLSSTLTHPNPAARLSFVKLCAEVLRSTPRALPQSQTLLLGHLLVLAYPALPIHTQPPMQDSKQALESLHALVPLLSGPLSELTSKALSILPHRLSSTSTSSSLLAKQLTTSSHLSPTFASSLLGPSGKIDKWGLTLLHTLRFTSPSIVPLVDPSKLIEPDSTSTSSNPHETGFPMLRLQGTDTETHKNVQEMFGSMGRAAGQGGMYAVEWFVGVAVQGTGERHVAAMWCALVILRGAMTGTGDRKKMVKTAKWVGRAVADLWDDVAGTGEDREEGEGETGEVGETLELVQTEHIKGLNPLTTLLDRPTPTSSSTASSNWKRTLELQSQHTSLALQLISTSHAILGSTSITLLQHSLYPLLQGLLSPTGLVSTSAHAGLSETAHALGYASPPNMLLANFDYALESVSRRLAVFSSYSNGPMPTGLSQSTPQSTAPSLSIQALQVLRALIRLIGRAIVDRAYDVLDECFDRLDDYHGYSLVVQALVDVLAEVVEAVGREDEGLAREDEREEREPEQKGEEIWEGFIKWFKERGETKEEIWDFDPNMPDPEVPELPQLDERTKNSLEPPPLSATQSLTRTIIARCTYFLTHPSPHIRARILSLLSTATPTLRASALLPTIHASWSFILNRMEDKEMWVVQKAFELVEVLSRHVSEFMARRVWDDAWPRFEKMLKAQAHTALTTRRGKSFPTRPGTMDDLGPLTLGRLHISILHTLTSAAMHVDPRDDALWSVLLACRRFLRKEEREDVQVAAREMYLGVARRNADAVWLVLNGMVSGGGDGVKMPGFLKEEWDVHRNVELILNGLE